MWIEIFETHLTRLNLYNSMQVSRILDINNIFFFSFHFFFYRLHTSVWLGFSRFGSVLAWFFRFGSVLALFGSVFFWFFFSSVRFGFSGSRLKKSKPNRTGRFFQNFNRFNRFFFTVRFFRVFFFLIFSV